MNAADVLIAILHALKEGHEPAMILAEDSPLMESAREALKPLAPPDETAMAYALLRVANWSAAPRQSRWGAGMMVADVMLTKDETLTLYAHKEALPPDPRALRGLA